MWLSVIIPAYNVEKYIGECLDSLVRQNIDKEEYEVICVDDGSSDKTPEILDEYAKQYSNICVIHKENEGVSVARNVGIENAVGEYLWFVDSDDFIVHNIFKDIKEFQKENMSDIMFVRPKAFKDGLDTTLMKFRGGV